MAAKAVAADAAIRRLDDAMQKEERDALEAAAANRALADSFDKLAEKAGRFQPQGRRCGAGPALIPLAGGLAAGVAAIGVSFGAAAVGAGLFGALAKSVFSNVSKDNQKLQTAQKQLAAAQIARAQATTKAQRTAADNQIFAAQDTIAAIRSEGAAYNQVLDLSKEIGTKWKVVSAQIASPALVPWLVRGQQGDRVHPAPGAARRGPVPGLGPGRQPVLLLQQGVRGDHPDRRGVRAVQRGPAVRPRGVLHRHREGHLNLGRDLAGHNVDFGVFSVYLDKWGGAFLRWSQSAAARQDVTKFLNWIHSNGPATAGLLKNLGGVLKAFAPGLSSVGSLELQLVSDFLGVLARTPKSIAKPLVDVAGALLLLQKTGVLKVGIKLVGTAAKLLSGGAISIGGGAAAAGEIRAAFASGGAAAAAEIRAAMAGGGAAGGAGGIGGGAAAGATAGKAAGGGFLTAFRAAITPAAAGVIAGALIRAAGDTLSPAGTFAGKLNKNFQDDGHLWSSTLLHSFTFGGLEAWLTTKIGLPVGKAMNNVGLHPRVLDEKRARHLQHLGEHLEFRVRVLAQDDRRLRDHHGEGPEQLLRHVRHDPQCHAAGRAGHRRVPHPGTCSRCSARRAGSPAASRACSITSTCCTARTSASARTCPGPAACRSPRPPGRPARRTTRCSSSRWPRAAGSTAGRRDGIPSRRC